MGTTLTPFWGGMNRNWILKLICLVFAIFVWQEIRDRISFEVEIPKVPVVVVAGEGRAVLEQSTDVVSIRFRGSREDLRFINRDQLSVELELAQDGSLKQVIKLSSRYVKGPAAASAVEFYPETIRVIMDREVERLLPIKATFDGTLPEDMVLVKAVCEPASVRVRGAERRLRDLEQVHALPVSLDGRYESFSAVANVAAEGRLWVVTPERIDVTVELDEQVARRQVEQIEVHALMNSEDSRSILIQPQWVSVKLKGRPDQIERLSLQDLVGYVHCSELTESAEYEVPVRVNTPKGITVESVVPSFVKVVVKKQK
jgi:YbbR domain-containing protein